MRNTSCQTHEDNQPIYNLKAVVKETGLKQDTLRAWERRYGIPQPDRTTGGHRLYTQRDIAILKWLVARQREGLSISRAVDLWQQLNAEGKDPLSAESPLLTPPPATIALPGGMIEAIRQSWIEACLAFDEKTAEQLLAQAAALYSPETVTIEFLQKGLAQFGQMWAEGQASVQQEHFASALAIRRLETLIAGSPGPTRPDRILVVCPPAELHIFSLLVVTFILRRNGWDTLFLGANVPVPRLMEAIQAVKPALVILSAQQLSTAATLLETTQLLQQEKIPIAYGGRIFNTIPALQKRIPGHFLGQNLSQTPPQVSQILVNPTQPPTIPITSAYHQALTHYQERQSHLETYLWETINPAEFSQAGLVYCNMAMARNIIGALSLGSMAYLNEDMYWATDMQINHSLSQDALTHYLDIYHQAAALHLGPAGQPVKDWLAQFATA
jgi:DNA-binding transcriptional MerR regulator